MIGFCQLALVCLLAMAMGASPARAASIPSAEEDGWGHFLGCVTVLLDSAIHSTYCGPARVPLELAPLGAAGGGGGNTAPEPSCGSCSGPAASIGQPLSPYQVASLSLNLPPLPVERRQLLAQSCCPLGSS